MTMDMDIRASDSLLIDCVWRGRSTGAGRLTSIASSHWHLVVSAVGCETRVSVHGPESRAVAAPLPEAGGRWVGSRSGGEFWLSSLVTEAVIHGVDAANAVGGVHHIETDVAAHLITNHMDMLTSPTWAAQRPGSAAVLRGAGETLRLHATDGVGLGGWFIERGPDGAHWQARSGEADVTLEGPAASLLLILTRRRRLSEETVGVSVHGDAELAERWIQNTAHVSG